MSSTPKPNIVLGLYPEQPPKQKSFLSDCQHKLSKLEFFFSAKSFKSYQHFVNQVLASEAQLVNLSTEALNQHVNTLREKLSLKGLTQALEVEVFAAVKQMTTRTLGISPYNTQLMAAKIMLDGKLAEMATGEGKTLTAGICVASAALAGIPVHLITANDYLVKRDAETLKPLFTALGLTVGTVTREVEFQQRQIAYAQNIVYTTAKELVFDYLRDKTQLQELRSDRHIRTASLAGQKPQVLLRGLYMAIIDEADSILIDEARVPLILSRSNQDEVKTAYYSQALTLAKSLILEQDFKLNQTGMAASLTDSGSQRLTNSTQHLGAIWKNKIYYVETICQALAALYLYKRDKQYIVDDDAVQIVDETTGRVSPGRVWSKGLHQLIELKEGCKLSGEMITMSQITYQRFFPKYLRLGGMSGTLNGLDDELFDTFNLYTNTVPLRLASERLLKPTIIFKTIDAQFKAAVASTKAAHQLGRPVLIGTDSVSDSEALSQLLNQAGLPHQVLNARQNAEEASIVAQAGQLGKITVSTNMAGRGTDIALSAEAKKIGGLHVISCQHNISYRIDRQLIGRCARQGDPGSAEMLLTVEKLSVYQQLPKWLHAFIPALGLKKPAWLVRLITRIPQWLEEYNQLEQRRELLKQDIAFDEDSQLNS